MAGASVQGCANLSHQWNIIGEFSNVPQEQLVEWINTQTQAGRYSIPLPSVHASTSSAGVWGSGGVGVGQLGRECRRVWKWRGGGGAAR